MTRRPPTFVRLAPPLLAVAGWLAVLLVGGAGTWPLLLAEGRSVHCAARQLGSSPALTLSTYGHLFAEYEHAERIDPEGEIEQARVIGVASAKAA